MKKDLVSIAALGCSGSPADKPIYPGGKEAVVQAGFYTPSRKGQMWDAWAYFREGRHGLFFDHGNGTGHCLLFG